MTNLNYNTSNSGYSSFFEGSYRYGFQAQEKDDEVKGAGNSVNFEYRMHDPRIGRFFAIDPLTKKYPHYSPYSFSGNKVISHKELEGKEEKNAIQAISNEDGSPALKVQTFKDVLLNRMENAGMTLQYGFPEVVYNPNIFAMAIYYDGKMDINYNFDNGVSEGAYTDDDWISVVRHEYEHFLDDKTGRVPLQMKEDGKTVANQKIVEEDISFEITDNELKAEQNRWDRENQAGTSFGHRPTEKKHEISNWRYAPSNLMLTEVNAYKAQLDGEKIGLYTMSDSFRTEIQARLDKYTRMYERSLDYEKKNNLNVDGSEK